MKISSQAIKDLSHRPEIFAEIKIVEFSRVFVYKHEILVANVSRGAKYITGRRKRSLDGTRVNVHTPR